MKHNWKRNWHLRVQRPWMMEEQHRDATLPSVINQTPNQVVIFVHAGMFIWHCMLLYFSEEYVRI